MKPFSGLHEAKAKRAAIRKMAGQGRCVDGDESLSDEGDRMSQIRKAFLAAVAITLTLGAVQFASGHDLVERWRAEQPGYAVNRASKADRLGDIKPFAVPTKTASLRLNDLADTSVLLRLPSAQARTTKPTTLLRNQSRKPTIACEPVVSALTEVAGLLPPGRCVT